MSRVASLRRRRAPATLSGRVIGTAAIAVVVLLVCSDCGSGQPTTEPPPFAAALRAPAPPTPHAVLPAAGSVQPASPSELEAELGAPADNAASSVTVSTSTTWRPRVITTTTTSAPAPNETQLLTLVYSSQLINDSAYAIRVWCKSLGSPALVTHEMRDTPVTASYGLWGPMCSLTPATNTTGVNFTYYSKLNISFYRSYLSVTTSADVLEELLNSANGGLIPGILCMDSWSTKNTKKTWAWVAGVAVASVASAGAFVLIAVQLVYKRGYVNATGPHLQNTNTYQDLEQARDSFEAKLGSHSSAMTSSSSSTRPHAPPLMPPPLPLRELQQLP